MQLFGEQVRFGVQCTTSRQPYAAYLENWLTCERLGYDIAYVTDHFAFPASEGNAVSVLESTTLLSAVASQSSRIRCGFMVLGNTFRNPGMLAKTVVTLDQISGGRLELGLGSGNSQFEHDQYNIPYYTRGRRLRMLGESIQIVRRLLTQDTTTFAGHYYRLQDAICEPKPVQSHLPILVGAIGEEIGLRIVAESADIWNVYDSPSPNVYQHRLDALARHCEVADRDAATIRKSMHIKPLIGESEQDLDERAPAQPRARGRFLPRQLVEHLMSFVALGVRDFVFMLDAPPDLRSLELLATEVAPRVRAQAASLATAGGTSI